MDVFGACTLSNYFRNVVRCQGVHIGLKYLDMNYFKSRGDLMLMYINYENGHTKIYIIAKALEEYSLA